MPVSAAASDNAIQDLYQWNSVAIGGGGFVSAIITSPDEEGLIYARTDVGGAYRWEPTESNWIPLNDWVSESQVGLLGIESLAIDPSSPNRVYMMAGIDYFNNGNTAFLRSDDYGETMEVINVTSQFKAHGNGMGRQNGERLAVDPHNGDILFAGTRRDGLFRSSDRGDTWQHVSSLEVSSTPNDNGISFVIFDERSEQDGRTQRIFTAVSVAGLSTTDDRYHGDNLYLSEDAGETWELVDGRPENFMPQRAVMSEIGELLITYGDGAGPHGHWSVPEPINNGAIWKYDIDTENWTNISPAGTTHAYGGISVAPGNPDRIVASTINTWVNQGDGSHGDRLFYSDDGGNSWTDLNQTVGIHKDNQGISWIDGHAIHWAGSMEMDPFDHNRVFITSGNGIFVNDDITDPESRWKFTVHGIEETVPLDAVRIPGGPLISVIGDYDGFVHHDISEYGPIHEPQIGTSTGVDYAEKRTNVVVRVGGPSDGSRFPIYYSEDTGESWTAFASTPNNQTLYQGRVAVSADGSAVLWKPSGGNTMYRTTDWGQNWSPAENISMVNTIPVSDPVNENVFYAYNRSNGSFMISTDAGGSFTHAGSVPNGGSELIRTAPDREGDIWIALNGGGLTRSTDSGSSFNELESVERASAVGFGLADDAGDYPTIFIWGRVEGVTGIFRSVDEGESWVRINNDDHEFGGPGNGKFVMGDPNRFGRVYMSTAGRGIVYGVMEGEVTSAPPVAERQHDIMLAQNYPNPFNPATNIRYAVPQQSHVTIRVFDVLGRQVQVLVNEVQQAGNYTVRFDASGLSSGTYLYRLEAGSHSEIRSMTYIK